MVRESLIFFTGLTIGGVIGMLIAEKRYNEHLEDAVNDRIDEIHEEEVKILEKQKEKEEAAMAAHKEKYGNMVRDYNGASTSKPEEKTDREEEEFTEEDEDQDNGFDDSGDRPIPRDPYLISEDLFYNSGENAKESLWYYAVNDLLFDDAEEMIEHDDAEILLGHDWRLYFEDGPGTVYIRNEKVSTDYEVTCSMENFPVN